MAGLRALLCTRALYFTIGSLASVAAACTVTAGATEAVDMATMMRLTVSRWSVTQVNGFLPYGFDFLSDQPLEPDRVSPANLVRQAFAAFSLASYYDYARDATLAEPLRQALSAFERRSLPIGKGRMQRAVESTRIYYFPFARWKLKTALENLGLLYQPSGTGKVMSSDESYGHALTGGVALALLTELVYARASGDERFARLRTAWLEGLLSLRNPGGGFREHPLSIDESQYSNGEGWLALAVYADTHQDDAASARELADIDDVFLRRYTDHPDDLFFAWGAMAALQRYRTTRDPRFAAYLRHQGDQFLGRFEHRLSSSDNNCATMEGIAAILSALLLSGETESERVRALREWLTQEMAKLPRLQIKPGQQGLGLGGDASLRAPRMAQYAGEFLNGLYEPVTQIDTSGHCLSALVTIQQGRLQ